ncbi:conserved Plasmodium protein, unknown function [Plasmodium ovale wallikeri]|uniref:Cilia- and flagella-associated protein 61 N-terminal domain-containing protein n=1 Tax=Plasmodium ovale wallikeri TaxID=864142 RepID=A0A1A9A1S4_PLAOA|nr:conserved Plasmodium protein, unknown function [Plasmodium ovale wallikeri]
MRIEPRLDLKRAHSTGLYIDSESQKQLEEASLSLLPICYSRNDKIMEYTFRFYKHKHLMRLRDRWKNLDEHVAHSSNELREKDADIREKKPRVSLGYEEALNIMQYSSVCITIFEKGKNYEEETMDNIIGIASLDYELYAHNMEQIRQENISLENLYYVLSLHIKKHNILSTLNRSNTIVLNLLIGDSTKYYHDLFSFIFHTFDDIVFILIFLKKENNALSENVMTKGLVIHLAEELNIKCVYDKKEKESTNYYLIYDIIEKKTENDILISILNSKKKIIGFVWLKKNIDLNILVNLYKLKAYGYLLKGNLFKELSPHLTSYKIGEKNMNKRKKKYLFVEFKQHILRKIKIESLDDLEKEGQIEDKIIYDFLNEHLLEDVEAYADYFVKKRLDVKKTINSLYGMLQYDYENFKRSPEKSDINLFLLKKLINLYSHISFSDVAKVSKKFHSHFEKIEVLYFNFNNDKTYKKIYENVKKKKEGIKSDATPESETCTRLIAHHWSPPMSHKLMSNYFHLIGNGKINIIKFNQDNGSKKAEKNFKEVIHLSYFDIFLLLQNIYPDTFKKSEVILLFLFLDLYEMISVGESTLFDCVSFKLYLDELVNIKQNYFVCKYKHVDWLTKLNNNDKNAFSLNLFLLSDKYRNHCKEVLLKIERICFDKVDYIIATNNERGNIPFILNYFSRVKKKKKANTLESLYVLNKYTLFLTPTTDYMRLSDIEDVQNLLKSVNNVEKEKIYQIILSLKEYCKREETLERIRTQTSEDYSPEIEFYREKNYYVFVSRCGGSIVNVTSGCIINNIDFYYKRKVYDFKNILAQNDNMDIRHFLLFLFSSIIIFKYYDKRIIHNVLVLTKTCSCHVSVCGERYSDVYNHFIFLDRKDNAVSILKRGSVFDEGSSHVGGGDAGGGDGGGGAAGSGDARAGDTHGRERYLVMTKQMCAKRCVHIDHNIVFWGINDICLSILHRLLANNEYFFNNIILIVAYKNKYLHEQGQVKKYNSLKNFSLESSQMQEKLKTIFIQERIKIIYDNVYNIDRKNKQVMLNNNQCIYYDYLFICFDKEDITTYSFQLNSYEAGKKKNFNFIQQYKNDNYKNKKLDFLVKAKDYEQYEMHELTRDSFCQSSKKNNKTETLIKCKNMEEKKTSGNVTFKKDLPKETEYSSNSSQSSEMYEKQNEGSTAHVKFNIGGYNKSAGAGAGAGAGAVAGKENNSYTLKGEKIRVGDKLAQMNKNEEENYGQRGEDHTGYFSCSSVSSNCLRTSDDEEEEEEEEEEMERKDDKSVEKVTNGEQTCEENSIATSNTISKNTETDEKCSDKDEYANGSRHQKEKSTYDSVNKHKKEKEKNYQLERSIEGVFSISDPFIDKHFDEKSKYMKIVKNCVSYIVLYSNNLDIMNMVNFFLKNDMYTYKIIIIFPYVCNRCQKKDINASEQYNVGDIIFRDRTYYKKREYLKNNYMFADCINKKCFYHRNKVFGNITNVLSKVFWLFRFLKIRIIYGKIIALKKNKNNRLTHVLVHFCKHKKPDSSILKAQKLICKNTLLIPCKVLLCSYIFDINNHLHYVLNKASIVYNQHICVNHNFQTNDKFIFSAGELCSFSNKYRMSKNNILSHEHYSSIEIGKLVSKRFLQIVINQCQSTCSVFRAKNGHYTEKEDGKDKCVNDIIENGLEEDHMTNERDETTLGSAIDRYKLLKVLEKPHVYFNELPCGFYFYHFQATNGDLSKFQDLCKFQRMKDVGKNLEEKGNSIQTYNDALCTDTLKISINNGKKIDNLFNVKHFDFSKNLHAEGYYCRVTTNSLNLISSFTYMGREKLNFHNLHKLCNMSINYFYVIMKNVKNEPYYDILSLLSEEREKAIFHYKFHIFKEKLKRKIIRLPEIRDGIHSLLKDVNDAIALEKYMKEDLFRDETVLMSTIREKVEVHLVEYIKENHEQLNGYYLSR